MLLIFELNFYGLYGIELMDVIDFCKYIHDLREQKLSRNEMERQFPWHKNTIKAYELDRLPDIDYLFALAKVTGADFSALVEMRLKVGLLAEHFNDDDALLLGAIKETKQSYLTTNYDSLLEKIVNDDSMFPTITIGATIYIDKSDKKIKEGGVFAVEFNDHIVPRRIQCGLNNSVMLVSDNPRFAPLNVPSDQVENLNIVGKVVSTLNAL
jgi:transcriptional regulator with XRE-family HTH domain